MKSIVFTVMTLNLRFGLADDGPNAWRHRKKIIPRLFEKYPADFIAFQEVNNFQADDLQTILKGYAFIGQRTPAPPFWQNNMIFHKQDWELCGYQHFFLSATPGIPSRARDSRWPRQCTMGLFQKKGFYLVGINTHFDFQSANQLESAGIILNRRTRWSLRIPTILVGDFNASPRSELYALLTKPSQKPATDHRTFKSVLSKPYEGTHHGFSGKSNDDGIDWILYTDDLMMTDWLIIQDHVKGNYYSDHFPVRATSVREPQPSLPKLWQRNWTCPLNSYG